MKVGGVQVDPLGQGAFREAGAAIVFTYADNVTNVSVMMWRHVPTTQKVKKTGNSSSAVHW